MYVNGDLVDTIATGDVTILPNTRPIHLGENLVGESPFNGTMDNVFIWSRALPQEELQYHHDNPGFVTNMTAQYKFDTGHGQNAWDESFNNNTGLLGGTSAPEGTDPLWTNGMSGKALDFDGIDDLVNCGNHNSLDLTGPTTISMWFNAEAIGGGGSYPRLLAKADATQVTAQGYQVGVKDTTNDIWVSAGGSTWTPFSGISTDEWYYFAIIMDGTEWKAFLNGNWDSTIQPAFPTIVAQDMYIGNSPVDNRPFEGIIDEVKIWADALSVSEIEEDYESNLLNYSGQWHFDTGSGQNVLDSSGTGNNGTLGPSNIVENADPAWTTAGLSGNALYFDGIEDFVTLPNDPSLYPENLTIEAWVNADTLYASEWYNMIFGAHGNSPTTSSGYYLNIDGTTETARFGIGTGGTWISVTGTTIIKPGVWYHLSGVINGDDISLYVNGSFEANDTIPNWQPCTLDYMIGDAPEASWDRYFDGRIDEISLFSHALSQTQLQRSYEQHDIPLDEPTGLLANWTMDEGTGQSVYDSSVNSNDGYLGLETWADDNDPTWGEGVSGKSLVFVNEDYVQIENDGSLNVTEEISVEAWIRSRVTANQIRSVIRHDGHYTALQILADGTAASVMFNSDTYTFFKFPWNGFFNDGKWHYFVSTYSAVDGFQIYLDGSPYASDNTITGSLDLSNKTFMLGAKEDTFGENFAGNLDEVKVWGEVLSAAEVSDRYNQMWSNYIDNETLLAEWHMEEVGTDTADDTSGNDYHMDLLPSYPLSSPQWDVGIDGSGLVFDGSGEYAETYMPQLKWEDDFTISLWIKPFSPLYSKMILWQGNLSGNGYGNGNLMNHQEMHLSMGDFLGSGIDNKLVFFLGDTHSGVDSGVLQIAVDYTDTTNWNHIAVVVSDMSTSPSATMYLNGVPVGTDSGAPYRTQRNEWSNYLRLGRPGVSDRYYFGAMDEVQIWTKALSSGQILQLYDLNAPSTLEGLWHFDDETNPTSDSSGNGHDGLLGGGTAEHMPVWTNGISNKALDFDGKDDYVRVDVPSDWGFDQEITVSAWFKPRSPGDSGWIFNRWLGDDDTFHLDYHSTGKLKFQISNSGDGNVQDDLLTQTSVMDTDWHHVVGVFDGPNQNLSIFLDGKYENSTITTFNSFYSIKDYLNIGRLPGYPTIFFNGTLDEMSIWSKALSPADISDMYQQGLGRMIVAQWHFDDGSGSTALDSSGNGYDGTLQPAYPTNAPTWVPGISNDALYFDGDGDYVEIPGSESGDLNFAENDDFTVSAWVKLDVLDDAYHPIVTKGDRQWHMHVDESNRWEFTNKLAAGGWSIVQSPAITGMWAHLVGIINGSQQELYVNGILVNNTPIVFSEGSTGRIETQPVWIGSSSMYPARVFNGTIDEVTIYNYALNGPQVLDLYQQQETSYLVAEWLMDEGSGGVANDTSGNGHHCTLMPSYPGDAPEWVDGISGTALDFDGTGDYIEDPNGADYINGLTAFTVECWVKSDVIDTDRGIYIAENPVNTDSTITLRYDAQGFDGGMNNTIKAGVTVNGFGDQQMESGPYAQTTEWQYLALTWESGHRLKLFIDGEFVPASYNTPAYNGSVATATKFIIGKGCKDQPVTATTWDGLIENVRIWSRVLTPAEIMNNYKSMNKYAALWHFDEGIGFMTNDSSPNDNDGQLLPAPPVSAPQWVNGISGKALEYDGPGYNVLIPHSESLDLTEELTVSLWVKPNDISKDNIRFIGKGDPNTAGWTMGIYDQMAYFSYMGAGTRREINQGNIEVGEWCHILATFDSSGGDLYLNGVWQGSAGGSILGPSSSDPILLGNYTGTYWFNGVIDELAIWDQALNGTEITSVFLEGATVLNVDNGERFINIQDAIDDVDTLNGHTLQIGPRAYYEDVLVNKQLNLEGAGNGITFIIGSGTNNPITVSADKVNISGLYVTGSGDSVGNAGILINSVNNCTVHHCTIASNDRQGILIKNSIDCSVLESIVQGNRNGIKINNADHHNVLNNTVKESIAIGVWLLGDSIGSFIVNNDIEQNLGTGIALEESTNMNMIFNNNFIGNANGQANDSGTNIWSMPSPTGGNYWDDWNTPDGDMDGFVDNPRAITGGVTSDALPFAIQSGWELEEPYLLGYWPFSEGVGCTTEDVSGVGNDGTLGLFSQGDDSEPTWTNGASGNALFFDGSDDIVDCGNDDSLNSLLSVFSLEAWIFPTGWGSYTYGFGRIIGKETIFLFLNEGYGPYNYNCLILGMYVGAGYRVCSTPEYSIKLNEWYHVVATYDGTDVHIYLNGVNQPLDFSPEAPSGPVDPHAIYPFVIGNRASDLERPFDGIIDEVRAYGKILTQDEVTQHYNENLHLFEVGRWRFDEGSGDYYTYDSSIYGNTGDLGPEGWTGNHPQWTYGVSNYALRFDGVDDYVSIDPDDSINNAFHGGGTASAWIKLDSLGENNLGRILNKADDTFASDGWSFLVDSLARPRTLTFMHGFSGLNAIFETDDNTLYFDKWIHVAVTYDCSDSNNVPKMYINGLPVNVVVTDAPSGFAVDDSTEPLEIGNLETVRTFDGIIDEAGLWKRMLSDEEIFALYRDGFGDELSVEYAFDNENTLEVTDSSGNGLDGYLGVSPVKDGNEPTRVAGISGNALYFDGNDLVTGSDDFRLDGPLMNRTWEVWVKMPTNIDEGDGSYKWIFSKFPDDGASEPRVALYVGKSDGVPVFAIEGSTNGDQTLIQGSTDLRDGEWHQIAIIRNRSQDNFRMFVDGMLDAAPVVDGDQAANPNGTLYIGTSGLEILNGRNWLGCIDELRIWNMPLKPSTILNRYNSIMQNFTDTESLEGLWQLNEGTGQDFFDSSSNGYDGYLGSSSDPDGSDPVWVPGRFGQGLDFACEYARVPSGESLNLTNEVTLEAWLDPLGSGWAFMRQIWFSSPTPENDFQVKIEFNPSNFNYTNARPDGSDIRFFAYGGTELDYWIQEWNPSGTSTVWVEVESAGTHSIAMFHGNSEASSKSSGSDTFVLFDDFDDGIIDTGIWDTEESQGIELHEENGRLFINGTGTCAPDTWQSYAIFSTKATLPQPFVYEYDHKSSRILNVASGSSMYYDDFNSYDAIQKYDGGYTDGIFVIEKTIDENWSTVDRLNTNYPDGTWHHYQLGVNDSVLYPYMDSTAYTSITMGDLSFPVYFGLRGVVNSSGTVMDAGFDNFFVRKYSGTEISCNIGYENPTGIYDTGAFGITADYENVYWVVDGNTLSAPAFPGWNYVVGTLDSTQSCLYVNGYLANSKPVTDAWLNQASTGLFLGSPMGYDGYMDRIGLWSRALSESEIAQRSGMTPPASGDWIINWTQTYSGSDIHIDGNIIVESPGHPTFEWMNLYCNDLIVEGGAQVDLRDMNLFCDNIMVNDGGLLSSDPTDIYAEGNVWIDGEYVLDETHLHMHGDLNGEHNIYVNSTGSMSITQDSMVSSNNTNKYLFEVRDGAQFIVKNSTITDCGWGFGNEGLLIYSDEAYLAGATLTGNFHGVQFNSSDSFIVKECNITGNTLAGILCMNSMEGQIRNCIVDSNDFNIIVVDSQDLNIIGSRCSNSSTDNIHFENSIAKVIDSKIENTGAFDYSLEMGSRVISLNTSFNKPNVDFDDVVSVLEVQAYLSVKVRNQHGYPVIGAAVKVFNFSSGMVHSELTDERGNVMNLVCTEYFQDLNGLFNSGNPHLVNASLDAKYNESNIVLSNYGKLLLTLDMDPYYLTGSYESMVFNAGFLAYWTWVEWHEFLPDGTDIKVQTRTGNSPDPNVTSWSPWSDNLSTCSGSGITSPQEKQFFQYKLTLTTNNENRTPILYKIKVHYSRRPMWVNTGYEDFLSQTRENTTAGENGILKLEPLVEWLNGWEHRKKVTILNTNIQDQEEYQIFVSTNNISASGLIAAGKMKVDFSDVRFTSNQGGEMLDYYTETEHVDGVTKVLGWWVKVPTISGNGNTDIYCYYGNPGAISKSSLEGTFSYSEPRTVGYSVCNDLGSYGLNVISLMDHNNISIGTISQEMQFLETASISAIETTPGTEIKAQGLLHGDSIANGADIFNPVSWAGSEFTYRKARSGTEYIDMVCPWGTASVTLYENGVLETTQSVTSSGTRYPLSAVSGACIRLSSDLPILAYKATSTSDYFSLYPSTKDYIYGVPSQNLDVSAGPSDANIAYTSSTGGTNGATVTANNAYRFATLGGQDGTGPAYRVNSTTGAYNAVSSTDGDGAESTIMLPYSEMGTIFGSANAMEYVAIATPHSDAVIDLYDNNGDYVNTYPVSGSGTSVFYGGINTGNDGLFQNGGWHIESNRPINVYYDESNTDDECNLLSWKQMRQFTYPTPELNSVGLEEEPNIKFRSDGSLRSNSIDSSEDNYIWRTIDWYGTAPDGTSVQLETRTSNDDENWTGWAPVNSPIASPPGRYLQWQVIIGTSNQSRSPVVTDVVILGNTNSGSAMSQITLDVFAPTVPEYALLDSDWNVISDNTIDGLIDVGQLYYFNATVKHGFGFGLIDNVTITAWHDMGDEANTYNSTHGANLNMMFRYQNDASTGNIGEFFMQWNGTNNETILHIAQCADIVHPTIANAHILSWAFTPGKQIRAANWTLPSGGVEGFNDLNSWNFNITAYDDWNINSTPIKDEFGVYKYVEVTADNDPSGAGRPGMLAPLSPSMNITSSANYRFKLDTSIQNLTTGTENISAERVEILWTSDGGATNYGWRAFSFLNETSKNNFTEYQYGDGAAWQNPFVNGSFNMTVMNWRVDIPVSQPEGTYTSPVYIHIEADAV